MKKITIFLVVLFLGGCTVDIPKIPLEDFFKNPEKSSFQLSPDGKKIAYMKPWEEGNRMMNVYIKTIGDNQEKRITNASNRSLYGYFWLNDDRIAYIQDKGGDENIHIYAVNIDGTNDLDLTPFENIQARITDDLDEDPDHMIVSINNRDPRVHDAYRLNVNTGQLSLIAENPGNIMGWMTDNDGKLRIALTSDGVNSSILYREEESDPFLPILTTNFKVSVSPLFFTFDNKELYVSSNRNRDKSAIYKFDLNTAKETDLIFEHDEVDVSGLIRSKKRKVLTAVSYYTDKRKIHFLDDWREKLQNNLESKLKGVEVAISDISKDETKAIIVTFSDVSRGTYYYYDIEKDELTKLADLSPWLDPNHMSEMKPIKYTSRDGLTINGYLTIPKGSNGKNLPVVVNPHGGPWARDRWGFNPEIQYLANNGYAVFQMNFRGSTGYGREFWEKSFKQWGKTMQDDITDGVQWLINEGIANPDKIGIYGASYGGYATLAGLTFTPDLYACGVDYVGVSSLFTFMESMPPYWELYREMMYEMVGHPEKDKELLASSSPLMHVDKIKVPLFIAQGANDPRVKKSESDQIVEALKQKGIDVPYMVKDDEGHGFYNEENRFDFYREMSAFLEKHLK
jgi:dipeptidyl aminopeptidase/acylaminoacyl peptidase|tara:strand:+ start:1046 stop:2920 length:1875 start_codon:yes stop_codon:yes gene_type:complete